MSKSLGKLGEEIVKKYFEDRSWSCCDQNVSFREGELDLVFCHDEHLLFVEVKTRTSSRLDRDYPRISFRKIKRYQISIFHYLEQLPCRSYEVKVAYVTLFLSQKYAKIQLFNLKDFFQ